MSLKALRRAMGAGIQLAGLAVIAGQALQLLAEQGAAQQLR